MKTLRRIALAVALVAMAVPSSPNPAQAHTGAGWAIEWGMRAGDGGTVVAGLVTNHTSSRQSNIQVTATWRDGSTVVATETTTAFISTLGLHSSSPFKLVESQDVDGATLTVTASGSGAPADFWNGPLGLEPGTLTDDVYTGTVRNDGESFVAENVRVFAVRRQGGIIVDAAGSVPIASLPAGTEAAFTIVFDDFAGESVGSLIAQGLGGERIHTSWNNWFRDLGTSAFAEEIAWLANENVTRGCDVQQFCPKSPVTREQMAVFLDRVLNLPTASGPAPFTDLAQRPEYVRQAVANVYEAGITAGCTATTYCPLAAVTRGQMSKFIVVGYELGAIPGSGTFTDDDGHFSEPYNNRMAADGITSGCATASYCPQATVLREQLAKFLFEAES